MNRITLMLFLLNIVLVWSCSRAPEKKAIRTDGDATYSFSAIEDVDKRKRQRRTNNYKRADTYYLPAKSACKHLRSGIEKLAKGHNEFFFSTGPKDVEPTTSILFDLTCDVTNIKDFGNFSVPKQIEFVESSTEFLHFEWQAAYESFKKLLEEEEFDGELSDSIPNVTYFVGEQTDKHAINAIRYKQEVFKAKIQGKIKPTAHATKAYDDLPQNYESDRLKYFEFIQNWGTSFYRSARFGGFVVIIVQHNEVIRTLRGVDIIDMRVTVADQVTRVQQKNNAKFISIFCFSKGGEFYYTKTWDDYKKSILEKPSIIEGETLPLTYFFEPNPTSLKSSSFMQAMSDEEMHQGIKRLETQLNKTPESSNPLRVGLLKILESEKQFIHPITSVYVAIKHGMRFNILLNQYHINFSLEPYMKDGVLITETKYFYLIRDVCVTGKQLFLPKGAVAYHTPANMGCFEVFSESNCKGSMKTVHHYTKLAGILYGAASFRLCI